MSIREKFYFPFRFCWILNGVDTSFIINDGALLGLFDLCAQGLYGVDPTAIREMRLFYLGFVGSQAT